MNNDSRKNCCVAYMPDGTPCPVVLLEEDVIKLLRLKELGVPNPKNTLRYYREIGKLKPACIGHHNVYTLDVVLTFLEAMTKKN